MQLQKVMCEDNNFMITRLQNKIIIPQDSTFSIVVDCVSKPGNTGEERELFKCSFTLRCFINCITGPFCLCTCKTHTCMCEKNLLCNMWVNPRGRRSPLRYHWRAESRLFEHWRKTHRLHMWGTGAVNSVHLKLLMTGCKAKNKVQGFLHTHPDWLYVLLSLAALHSAARLGITSLCSSGDPINHHFGWVDVL